MYSKRKKLLALEIYKRNFGNVSKVCKDIGIERSTFYFWVEENTPIYKGRTFKQLMEESDFEVLDVVDNTIQEMAVMGKNERMIRFFAERRHPKYKKQDININLGMQEQAQESRSKIDELLIYAKQLPAVDKDTPITDDKPTDINEESSTEDNSEQV